MPMRSNASGGLLPVRIGFTVLGLLLVASGAGAQVIMQGQDNVVVPTAIDSLKPTTSDTARPSTAPPQAPAAPAPAQPAPPKKQAAKKKAVPPTPAQSAAGSEAKQGESPGESAVKTAARGPATSSAKIEQSIVALVNDEPVTGYEVTQRAQMLAGGEVAAKAQANFKALIQQPGTTDRLKAILGEVIKANQSKSKEQILAIFEQKKKEFAMSLQRQAVESAKSSSVLALKKNALEELIDEKLKMQEAKRVGAVASDDDIDHIVTGIAERNKMTKDQLSQQFGGSLDPLKNRVRSTLAWSEVIRRKFGHQVSIASKDVDKFVSSSTTAADDQVELQIQRIVINMPAKLDQTGVAQRVSQAEAIRSKFKDCKSGAQVVAGIPGARFEDLGKRNAGQFPEPTRSMLLNAKEGEMLPPAVEGDGVNMFAVCGRNAVKGQDEKRTQAESELRQKELDMLAKRYLKDLRQDAHIEYR